MIFTDNLGFQPLASSVANASHGPGLGWGIVLRDPGAKTVGFCLTATWVSNRGISLKENMCYSGVAISMSQGSRY
jgi:hypothetical protein